MQITVTQETLVGKGAQMYYNRWSVKTAYSWELLIPFKITIQRASMGPFPQVNCIKSRASIVTIKPTPTAKNNSQRYNLDPACKKQRNAIASGGCDQHFTTLTIFV